MSLQSVKDFFSERCIEIDIIELQVSTGSVNSAVRISPEKMADITQAIWVDVCQSQ
jgi:hypothetical protein